MNNASRKQPYIHAPQPTQLFSRSERVSSAIRFRLKDGRVMQADRILLCAGAIASSEILLRSMPGTNGTAYLDDNENYLFPIVSWHGHAPANERYFAFGEATLWFEPQPNEGTPVMASIAPVFNYLFDFYLPAAAIGMGRYLSRWLRHRTMLVRLHMDGSTATRYALSLSAADRLSVRRVRSGASAFRAKTAIKSLRQVLRGSGFFLPPFPLMRAATSAHYCGGFSRAGGGRGDPLAGPVLPGVWLADSAAFPRLAPQPPTFTIMAFAARAARQALAA